MTTDDHLSSADLGSPCLCPLCQRPIEVREAACPACGADLAWAAAQAERQVLASIAAAAGAPYKGDAPLPRFGGYLLRHGYITETQLSAALAQQREAAQRGVQQIIGQTLFELGAVTHEQLDSASVEQVRQLREALQAANRQLEDRVADRTRALQQALQQLTSLSELKSNLLGNLSHALRSPVVPIRGYGSMLIEGRLGPLTAPQKDAIETMLRCANQLDAAINELGQFTADFKGQIKIQPVRVTVPILVGRLERFFAPKAQAAQIHLQIDLAPDLPAVSADAEKICWALFQLTEQPLKHMAAGQALTLTVSMVEGRVRFAVRDMAPSLPPAQRDEILHRPPEFISRLADSRGWSLAQIRRIVEAHGTRFAIEDQPEPGTTVWFELPGAFALQP